jgi:hypothetical protein
MQYTKSFSKLLTYGSAKIDKTRATSGAWEAVLYMSPATESVPYGGANLCPNAGACANICLGAHAGRMHMPNAMRARLNRTFMYLQEREAFYAQLGKEIDAHVRRARRKGLRPAIRPNGSQDLRGVGAWVSRYCAAKYGSEVAVYDYTKIAPFQVDGYHLTYSHSERPESLRVSLDWLSRGGSVAVVFAVRKGHPLPKEWNGYPVIDGDQSDARFTDAPGSVVGLRVKGSFKKSFGNPFVVIA